MQCEYAKYCRKKTQQGLQSEQSADKRKRPRNILWPEGTRESKVTLQDRSSVLTVGRSVCPREATVRYSGAHPSQRYRVAGSDYVTKIESCHGAGWRSCRHENIGPRRQLIDLPPPKGGLSDANEGCQALTSGCWEPIEIIDMRVRTRAALHRKVFVRNLRNPPDDTLI